MKRTLPKRKAPAARKPAAKKARSASSAARIVLRRILVPVDFSDNSKKALRYAVPFAEQFGAAITVIYVVEPAVFPSDFGFGQLNFPDVEREMNDKAVSELMQVANEAGGRAPIASVVRSGIPFVEVTAYADENDTDLIILATHGRTGVEHILFGSTAEKIIRKAPCPVLVVRAEEHEFIDDRV
ncbi:MAG: universal stress protein [Bacteroidetes bacterium]|nr:MAG: universal stress protein [Bacteroidota bacterium]